VKRASHLFDQIADRGNLREAFHKAASGKRDRHEVREFSAHLDREINRLRLDLLDDQLELGHASTFTIHDPKKRVITAPCFRERVLHHAILNVCEPVFEQFLITDTFACRSGKGRIAALHRAMQFSRRFDRAIKLDFKDGRLLNLFAQIVYSHGSDGRGLPIGSLTSQHFANFYLAWFDRYVKERLRIKGFVRYMDDCVIWGQNRSDLKQLAADCRDFLSEDLGLTVHNTTPIFKSRAGLDFLGCRVFPDHLQLNRRSRHRYRARLRDLDRQYASGTISESELQKRSEALTSFTVAGGVRSWKFRHRVLQTLLVSGHGLEPGAPGRQLEQLLRGLPFGEP
jgi:RNA-directed DNA polymerase